MKRKVVRLTEGDLHRIIKNSVNRILKEVEIHGLNGRKYSLHGTDADSWEVMKKLRHDLSGEDLDYYDEHEEASKRDEDNENDVISHNIMHGIDNQSDIFKHKDKDKYYDETVDDEEFTDELCPNEYTNHDDYSVIKNLDDVVDDIRLKSKQTLHKRHDTKRKYDDKKYKAPIIDFQSRTRRW